MASVKILSNCNSPFWIGNDMHSHPLEDILRHIEETQAHQQTPWVPTVDMTETEKEYIILAELPGVKREDITLDYNGKFIILSGLRTDRKREKNERIHREERYHGKFTRSFKLPKNADNNKIEANYENGVLEVKIGKITPTSRKIQINSPSSSPASSSFVSKESISNSSTPVDSISGNLNQNDKENFIHVADSSSSN